MSKERVRDYDYMRWVKTMPCLLVDVCVGCLGPVEAHHAGERGFGQKAPDDTCIPLCTAHHRAWHDGKWPFLGVSKEMRRSWAQLAIAFTRLRWNAAAGSRTGVPF
jgi:hypothetical protein